MVLTACVRKEYKGQWERRTPLVPATIKTLLAENIGIQVERSRQRIFEGAAYEAVGATLVDSSGTSDVVLGIKEPPLDIIKEGQVHLCFSHTIKGQSYNMDLLRLFLEKGATLIDYEVMCDDSGERVIAFGRYAGIAGAVDTFHTAGRKYAKTNKASSLTQVKQTWEYGTIIKLKQALQELTLSDECPLRVLIVGTGNVGLGAEEACQWMGLSKISPAQVLAGNHPGSWYCMLATPDVVAARDGASYNKSTYREYGTQKYDSSFSRYLGKFDILLQAAYWEEKYPRHLSREDMVTHHLLLPSVIGDISCDLKDGSLACTFFESSIDEPAYTYLPESHEVRNDILAEGIAVMAIGHLPCELSLDASEHFSNLLKQYLPEVIRMDLTQPMHSSGLSRLMQGATIVYRGELTPRYAYLQSFLDEAKDKD